MKRKCESSSVSLLECLLDVLLHILQVIKQKSINCNDNNHYEVTYRWIILG